MSVKIAIPKETIENENRVALIPEVAQRFIKLGAKVSVQQNAGLAALIPDSAYVDAGVEIESDLTNLYSNANMVFKVQPPTLEEVEQMPANCVLIGFMSAHLNLPVVKKLQDKNITCFAMELIPRITRAQSMDALSSQAAVAGYKAALIAANQIGKFLPMLTTAAGTVRPAKALIIGAGVAGLQAIATMRRLGAVVEGYDVRPETAEQIQSLGAKFLKLGVNAAGEGGYARELTDEEKQAQQKALQEHLTSLDVVITTAAIPGRPAPKILSEEMVSGMKAGAVIVDIAAEGGGNTEVTTAGQVVIYNDVQVVGPVNLASQMPIHASEMYARNIYNLMSPWITEGIYEVNWDDEVMAGCVLTHDGDVKHAPTQELMGE
ncbi:MAG: Re/Si-specific NAD(P)(+) transhydrogenase subunit alpha [bacterium]